MKLNVGGDSSFMFKKSLVWDLKGAAKLKELFTGRSNKMDKGRVFVDRNPRMFGYLLDYIRNGCKLP